MPCGDTLDLIKGSYLILYAKKDNNFYSTYEAIYSTLLILWTMYKLAAFSVLFESGNIYACDRFFITNSVKI